MTRYFAKKFAPAPPLVVLGSSYKSSPECKPEQPLYDNWLDQSHPHVMGPALYSHRKLLLVGLSQWLVSRQTFTVSIQHYRQETRLPRCVLHVRS